MRGEIGSAIMLHPLSPSTEQSETRLGIARPKWAIEWLRVGDAMVVGHALALVAIATQCDQVGPPIEIVLPFGCHAIAFFAAPSGQALRSILDASKSRRPIPFGQELESFGHGRTAGIGPDGWQRQKTAVWIAGEQAEVPLQFHPLVPKKALPDEMKGKGAGGQRITGHGMGGQRGFKSRTIRQRERAEERLRHTRYREAQPGRCAQALGQPVESSQDDYVVLE